MESLKHGAREFRLETLPSGDGVKMHVECGTHPKVEFDTYVLQQEILESIATKAEMKNLKYVRSGLGILAPEEQQDIGWWWEVLDGYPNQLVSATKQQSHLHRVSECPRYQRELASTSSTYSPDTMAETGRNIVMCLSRVQPKASCLLGSINFPRVGTRLKIPSCIWHTSHKPARLTFKFLHLLSSEPYT